LGITFSDGHLPSERPRTDGQSATECRHAIHHAQVTQASIPCHNGCVWHLAVAVSFPTLPAGRPPTSPTATAVGGVGGRPWRSAMWVVVRGGWRGSDFNQAYTSS